MQIIKNNWLLVAIVFIGFLLRIVGLTFLPPSLNWDEVSHGINAYSILNSGVDEWGQSFPLTNFRAYGDYPLPLNLYLTMPFIATFGLTEFAIRLPHVILGTMAILVSYLLTFGITKRKNLSLMVAFLVSVTPWYLFTSRFVLQSNISIFLLALAMVFFVYRQIKKIYLPISMVLLFFTLFSYHTTRIFSPLLILALLVFFAKDFLKNKLAFVFAVLVIVLSAIIVLNPQARARSNVVFLIDQGAVNRIIEQRNNAELPEVVERIIFNRPVYFLSEATKNYISYFSPQFLFLEGGTQYQFSIPKHGVLYLVSLPFFYYGLFILLKRANNDKNYRTILIWLLLAPIPASITRESFAVLRATTLLPIPEILVALGLFEIVDKKKIKSYSTIVVKSFLALVIVSLAFYLKNYITDYRVNYSWAWQYGYKEVASFVESNYESYDQIVVTKKYGEPHAFLLFYLKWHIDDYRNDKNLIRYEQDNWFWVDRFDKFWFVNDWEIPQESETFVIESRASELSCEQIKCLLITTLGKAPAGWSKIKSVNFLDGKTAFELYEN